MVENDELALVFDCVGSDSAINSGSLSKIFR